MSSKLDEPLARRVAWLMLARVVLLLLVLAAAASLGGSVGVLASENEGRVLQAVVAGLVATVGSGLAFRRFHNPLAFGAVQVTTDIGVATVIIHATGGADSVFAFLHVIIVAYAALIFDRRLSVGAAVTASLAYAGSLLWSVRGPAGVDPLLPPLSLPLALADAAVKAGALLVVAALASGLARELARADRALEERTRDFGRLRDLHELTVQSVGSGLLTVDPAGVVRSINREAQRIAGAPATRALGRPLAELLPGAECMLHDGNGRQRERMRFVGPDGEALHLGLAVSVLRDSEGRPSGHVVIFQDITAIVEMEQELRRSERLAAVGELAAGIAHEVRNPLASISGSVQMLRSGLDEVDSEQRRLMDIVLRETDRLDALIGDFLHYARPAPPKPEATDLAGLAAELREMIDAARPAGVAVQVDIEPGLHVLADPDQLRQLLWNLVRNADQAMPTGGELRLCARSLQAQEAPGDRRNDEEAGPRAWVEIMVSDTGTGISPEVLDRVFDPFFTTKPKGSGLGLALVHRIVEANEGTVSVESQPGRGTHFRLRFPAATRSASDASEHAEERG